MNSSMMFMSVPAENGKRGRAAVGIGGWLQNADSDQRVAHDGARAHQIAHAAVFDVLAVILDLELAGRDRRFDGVELVQCDCYVVLSSQFSVPEIQSLPSAAACFGSAADVCTAGADDGTCSAAGAASASGAAPENRSPLRGSIICCRGAQAAACMRLMRTAG